MESSHSPELNLPFRLKRLTRGSRVTRRKSWEPRDPLPYRSWLFGSSACIQTRKCSCRTSSTSHSTVLYILSNDLPSKESCPMRCHCSMVVGSQDASVDYLPNTGRASVPCWKACHRTMLSSSEACWQSTSWWRAAWIQTPFLAPAWFFSPSFPRDGIGMEQRRSLRGQTQRRRMSLTECEIRVRSKKNGMTVIDIIAAKFSPFGSTGTK